MKKSILRENQREVTNDTQRMTSLEIAELAGKQHNDVLKAIRKMEPAWMKVTQGNFSLSTYKDTTGRTLPCYLLTKTECLYIATKFNDEARAKLVLRWEQLERANALNEKLKMKNERCLPEPEEILRLADNIIGDTLAMINADAEDTLTATQVAKMFNMLTVDFNAVLADMGIQYRRDGRWNIARELEGRDLVCLRTYVGYTLKGKKTVRTYMTWTIKGVNYLKGRLGYPNF